MQDDAAAGSTLTIKWPLVLAMAVPLSDIAAQILWEAEWQRAILTSPVVLLALGFVLFDLLGQQLADVRLPFATRSFWLFMALWSAIGGYGVFIGVVRHNTPFYVAADIYHWFLEIPLVALIFFWACYRYSSTVVASHLLMGLLVYGAIGIVLSIAGLLGLPVGGGSAVAGTSHWRLDLGRGFPLIPLTIALALFVSPPRSNRAWLRTAAVPVIAVLGLVLIFTLKRTQWLLFPVALLGLTLPRRYLARSLLLVPTAAILWFAAASVMPNETANIIGAAKEAMQYTDNWTIDQTLRVREVQSSDAIQQVIRRPLGEGFGGELITLSAEGKRTERLHYLHSLHAYYLLQLGIGGYVAAALLVGALLLALFNTLDSYQETEWMRRGTLTAIGIILLSGISLVSSHTTFAGLVIGLALVALRDDDLRSTGLSESADDDEADEGEQNEDPASQEEDDNNDDLDETEEANYEQLSARQVACEPRSWSTDPFPSSPSIERTPRYVR